MELTELSAFCRRVAAELSPAQQAMLRARDAERLAITATEWTAILGHNVDVALLREVHRAVTGALPMTRRADAAGEWDAVPSRAGHVRSQPQSFRLGSYVERAWEHSTLKRRMAELLNAVVAASPRQPVTQAARAVWAVTRAQPFAGDNVRVALVVASRMLASAGLPVVGVVDHEHAPEFQAALIAATADQCDQLTSYLSDVAWDEALRVAEWLGAAPASERDRWSLADEHRALEVARARARVIAPAELELFAQGVAGTLVPMLEGKLAASLVASAPAIATTFDTRLRAAEAANARGHHLCPHQTIYERHWSVDDASGLRLAIVAGSAGRGITGAAVIHTALELPGVPLTRRASAMLVIPDEVDDAGRARLTAWAPGAVERMLRDSPLRC